MPRTPDIIAVQLTEHDAHFAHVRVTAQGPRIIEVERKDLRELAPEDVSKNLRAGYDALKLKKAMVLSVVPVGVITTKNIEIPSLDPAEIRSIIDLQAGRHTPYAREDIMVSYVTIGVFQRNYTKVLLVIVNRKVIQDQLAQLESAGIKVDRFVFGPEGVAAFYARLLGSQKDDTAIGVIDIARETTQFIVGSNQTLAFCRSIPLGMSHLIQGGQEAGDKWLAELQQSVTAYQNEDIGELPQAFVLTSDDAKVKELQAPLQEALKVSVRIQSYLDSVEAPQPTMVKLVSNFNDDSFLSCIATAAEAQAVQVDLTPEELKTQRQIEEQGRQVIQAASLAILILILICGIFFGKVYFRNAYLEKVKAEYTKRREQVAALDLVAERTRIVQAFVNQRQTMLEIIDELYAHVPREMYIEEISVNDEGLIDLRGVSDSMSQVFEFVSDLENSMLFKNVKTRSTTNKKDRGKSVSAFELSFRLESAKDEGEEEAVPEEEAPVEEDEGA